MSSPSDLSVYEIRKFMLANGGRVTNHALVNYFKKFLTHPQTQNEARKQFKTYVNILATIKSENNQRYLFLRKKYQHECPSEEVLRSAINGANEGASTSNEAASNNSSTNVSVISEEISFSSPGRAPPPYIPPPAPAPMPIMSPAHSSSGTTTNEESIKSSSECVSDFVTAIYKFSEEKPPELPPKEIVSRKHDLLKRSISYDLENVPPKEIAKTQLQLQRSASEDFDKVSTDQTDNSISVKEAMRKFNRMASEEETKNKSTPAKKPSEKQILEKQELPEATLAHPKAKEWIVAMAKASYHELAKLANNHPELVKLQDPASGYTALHWAAKHGNEDVVKLIAGTLKADVNARSNGGYTPLHLAIQFGRENIFELLWNVYKANRDLMDWSGNKPLDYSQQRPSVSASTFSKIKARKKPTVEKDLSFLRIGSLNVRVKKTTEAFSNFLGVGHGSGSSTVPTQRTMTNAKRHARQRSQHHHRHARQAQMQHHASTVRNRQQQQNQPDQPTYSALVPLAAISSRASVPSNMNNMCETMHKSWSSVDNISHSEAMPPPSSSLLRKMEHNKRKSTKSSNYSTSSSNLSSNLHTGYSSMPTTPNQTRSTILNDMLIAHTAQDSDSDSAFGFDSNWSVSGRGLMK